METFEVPAQDYARVITTSMVSLKTSIQVTIFIKHNAPVEKQCKFELIVVDEEGTDNIVAASLEFNVEDHFGAAYAQ